MFTFNNHVRRAVMAATLLLALPLAAATPKYIFYFIGDGMGMGPVMATECYNRLIHDNATRLLMTRFPVNSWAQTYSYSSPVTDSAAAGTALSTGHKTRNSMLGMGPDTTAVYSIAKYLYDEGYGIGIVTSGAADDATPGAFYAHVPNRSMFYEIGKDAAACGYDFIAGAGLRGTKKEDGTPNDLYDILATAGVEVLRGADGAARVATSSSKRIMLLNPEGYGDPNEIGFAIDSVGNDGVGLTLPMMTEACLDHLLRNKPDRFFMMVEGSLIDHALHGNDGSAAIREIADMDRCVAIAYDFYLKHPDETLIVITADHDTGGMTVGCRATGYNAHPANVEAQRLSKGVFSDYCVSLLSDSTKQVTWDEMKAYLTDKLGFWDTVKLSDKQTQALEDAFRTAFIDRTGQDEKGLYKTSNAFASEVFRVYSDATGWGFTTPNHTGNPVPVFAVGVGAEALSHNLNNTDIPAIIIGHSL